MSFFYIDPETYQQYRDQVIEMSQSIQVNYPENLPPETRRPGFSDEQIAEKLDYMGSYIYPYIGKYKHLFQQ